MGCGVSDAASDNVNDNVQGLSACLPQKATGKGLLYSRTTKYPNADANSLNKMKLLVSVAGPVYPNSPLYVMCY